MDFTTKHLSRSLLPSHIQIQMTWLVGSSFPSTLFSPYVLTVPSTLLLDLGLPLTYRMNFIVIVPFVVSHRTIASSFSDIFGFQDRVDMLRNGLVSIDSTCSFKLVICRPRRRRRGFFVVVVRPGHCDQWRILSLKIEEVHLSLPYKFLELVPEVPVQGKLFMTTST